MRKIILVLSLIFVPLYVSLAQTKEAFDFFTTPIGKSMSSLSNAAIPSGWVLVDSDNEENGKVEIHEFINKMNQKLRCQLKFYQSSKKCFAADFLYPIEGFDSMVDKLSKAGKRDGVYYHWKMPNLGYEVMLSKDRDKGVFHSYMFLTK